REKQLAFSLVYIELCTFWENFVHLYFRFLIESYAEQGQIDKITSVYAEHFKTGNNVPLSKFLTQVSAREEAPRFTETFITSSTAFFHSKKTTGSNKKEPPAWFCHIPKHIQERLEQEKSFLDELYAKRCRFTHTVDTTGIPVETIIDLERLQQDIERLLAVSDFIIQFPLQEESFLNFDELSNTAF
ncbi:MAG: hypothetical protein ACKO34_04115, partial [Vampirovibrionales bacterium]